MRQALRSIRHRSPSSLVLAPLSLGSPLGQGVHQRLGRYRRSIGEDRLFHGVLAGARDLRVTQPLRRFRRGLPLDAAAGKRSELRLHGLLSLARDWGGNSRNVIEPAKQGMI